MPDQFAEMDKWSSDQISIFKERARFHDGQVAGAAAGAVAEAAAAAPPLHLVAEGDSWFDYLPGTDLIDCLKGTHGYHIDNYADAGDTLENMIYGTKIGRKFQPKTPTIERVLDRITEVQPKAFLFSGGGNDVAGEEFGSFLNHKTSGLPVLRASYASYMIDDVFRKYFEDLIAKVASASPQTHIVVHGYARTVPTGEGVDILFWTFTGPWLRPALAQKRIGDPAEQRQVAFEMIDRYNNMLASLDNQYSQFHHVDLRNLIDPDNDWANELHLKNSAFARVAHHLDQVIRSL